MSEKSPAKTLLIKLHFTAIALCVAFTGLYLASINLGGEPLNRADAAFGLMVGLTIWLIYKNHFWMQKGYTTFQVMKAQHEASQAVINSILKHIPEESHNAVLEGIVNDGIAQVINLVNGETSPLKPDGQQSTPPSD